MTYLVGDVESCQFCMGARERKSFELGTGCGRCSLISLVGHSGTFTFIHLLV